ncbi:DUF4190 domain-containing protein [Agrococcus carbonis]|uniref:DUF4190 domain-containing protein n=1 Tax=Agrococcus carbonis TaxID=684552 RepID=A0A1H1N1V2_9MICO|nr:DUF4190 domain-containing protein [Agrococcus carbonis]SDR93043.1 hypothetical protein SAMN04489719_1149 [Agrococcus carbonis]
MDPNADRFGPWESGGTAEQSPPAPHAAPHASPHAAPPTATHASAFGAVHHPRFGSPATQFGLPPRVQPHFSAGFDGRDAPLIHPAAAQASSLTPYGVPVYRAPAPAPVPQVQRGLSTTALVLGICSFVFAWIFVVVPIIGIVFGILALRREPAGRVMAIVGLVGSGLGLLLVLLIYVLPLIVLLGAMLFAVPAGP